MIGKFRDYDIAAVKAAQEYTAPGAGGYVMRVLKAENVEDKEYVLVTMDIAEGPFANYGKKAEERNGNDWSYFRGFVSYKEYDGKVTWRWDNFLGAIGNSNSNFPDKFNGDEQLFVGKLVGVVLFEEEYENSNGDIKVRTKVDLYTSVDKIHQGKFKVKPLKRLEPAATPTPASVAPAVDDDDVPF